MLLSIEKAAFVSVVSCTLHSMVWVQGNIADIHRRIVNGVWDKYSWKRHNYTSITQTISCNTRRLRSQFCEYLNSETGSVSWQNKHTAQIILMILFLQ